MGWYGFDLDGTLAEWGEGTSNPGDVLRVGQPIVGMVRRVRALLAEGKEVRIVTARVGPATPAECLRAFAGRGEFPPYTGVIGDDPLSAWMAYQRLIIDHWALACLGQTVPITAEKDFHMYVLFDDRAIQVITNTGETLEESYARRVTDDLK